VQTKTGKVLALALAHDVRLAVMRHCLHLTHREGCCLRTDTAATLSGTKKVIAVEDGSPRAESA